MLEEADSRSDAPARKPKQPFLKRGEGVRKRLDAYKYRRPRQQSEAGQTQDYDQQAHLHPTEQPRSTEVDQDSHGGIVMELQEASTPDARDRAAGACSPPWLVRQEQEDLELEEFRALEREIFGANSGQQQLQQLLLLTSHLQGDAAIANSASAAAAAAAPTLTATGTAAISSSTYNLANATPAAEAAADVQDTNVRFLDELKFQDDSEWVDTEFPFSDHHLAETEQQPTPKHDHKVQKQQQQQQQGDVAAACEDMLAQQPYVRSLFAATRGGSGTGRSRGRGRIRGTSTAAAAGQSSPAAELWQQQMDVSPERQEMFGVNHAAAVDCAGADVVAVPAEQVLLWQQLEAAQPAMQQEKAALKKMRVELERAAARLQQERNALEHQKVAAQSSLEAWRADEARRLARERRVLEQQSKALLKLPSKKEKSSLEVLEGQLEKERSDARAAAARHKLTVERLRCQIQELQERSAELAEEVRWHETQALNSTTFVHGWPRHKPPCCSVQTQTDFRLALPPLLVPPIQQQPPATLPLPKPLYAALFADDEEAAADEQQPQQQQQQKMPAAPAEVITAGDVPAPGILSAAAVPAADRATNNRRSVGPPQQPGGRRLVNSVAFTSGRFRQHDQQQGQQGQQQEQLHQMQELQERPAVGQTPGGGSQQAHANDVNSSCSSSSGRSSSLTAACDSAAAVALGPPDTFTFSPVASRSADATSAAGEGRHVYAAAVSHHSSQAAADTVSAAVLGPTAAGKAAGAASSIAAGPVNSSSNSRMKAQAPDGQLQLHGDQQLEGVHTQTAQTVHFPNGTVKLCRSDGSSCVRFTNGDVKQCFACGRVDYYYAQIATWQVSHPGGVEVYYFPSGQVEAHHGDGSLEIIFPDGATHRVLNGQEEEIAPGMLSAAVRIPPPAFWGE